MKPETSQLAEPEKSPGLLVLNTVPILYAGFSIEHVGKVRAQLL